MDDFIKVGDLVRVKSSLDQAKRIQPSHGGWVDDMETILGHVGYVKNVDGNDDLRVKFKTTAFTLAPQICRKLDQSQIDQLKIATAQQADSKRFERGDFGVVTSDANQLKQLQVGHGDYTDEMRACLGSYCFVKIVLIDGDLRVRIKGSKLWTLNPDAVTKIADIDTSERVEEEPIEVDDVAMKPPRPAPTNFHNLDRAEWTYLDNLIEKNLETFDLLRLSDPYMSNMLLEHDEKTLLIYSCMLGRLEISEILMENGAKMDITSSLLKFQPIHAAAAKNHHQVVNLLLDKGADVNCRAEMKATPLHVAVGFGHTDTVTTLISRGANISLVDSERETPLHIAAMTNHLSEVSTLLKQGDAMTHIGRRGTTAFHVAAMAGHSKALRLMLQEGSRGLEILKEPVQWADADVLLLAALNGQQDTVRTLLSDFSMPATKVYQGGMTVLHLAAFARATDVVRVLIEKGAEVNATNVYGNTPLHMACLVGDKEIVTSRRAGETAAGDIAVFLLQKGADPTVRNRLGKIPLDLCTDAPTKNRIRSFKPQSREPPRPAPAPARPPAAAQSASAMSNRGAFFRADDMISPEVAEQLRVERERLEKLRLMTACPNCKANEREVVFNCGHLACMSCADRLVNCYQCQQKIIDRIRMF